MYNFTLEKKEYIDDIAAEAYLYRHSCGARLIFIKNDDKNRVVMPVFKTLPTNDKGIPHIVEHCTLCGSEKYRLKDPFNVLEKGSIYTYLNAITYGDKTVYPVASTDEDELKKMTMVYADAVFKPLLVENEGIFRQEGIYRSKDGINGVVLNEMEGAFSSESKLLGNKLKQVLYSNCNYKNYSGGVPDDIKTLGYDEFVEFYKTRYCGENCLIYIYGDVDIEFYMQLFDNYLDDNSCEKVCEAVIVNNSDEIIKVNAGIEAQEFCGAMFACCEATDYMECVLLTVLERLLTYNNNSILTKCLVNEGKAVKVESSYDDSSKATNMYIYANGAKIDDFRESLNRIFSDIAENGIPEEDIKVAVDKLRFYINERDFGYKPQGLFWGLELMKSMLYDDTSFDALKLNDMLDAALNADYKALIKKYFLNKGIYGYTVKQKKAEIPCDIPINDESLRLFQAQTDSEAMLNKIKPKSLSSIKPKPNWFDYSFKDGCIYTEDSEGDIVYLDLVYPIQPCDAQAASLYAHTAVDLDKALAKQIDSIFGRFYINAKSLDKNGDCLPYIAIKTAFMRDNLQDCVQLINRLINHTDFSDSNELRKIINKTIVNYKNGLLISGNYYAIQRALAMINTNSAVNEKMQGVSMYNYLKSDIDFLSKINYISTYIKNTEPIAVLRSNKADRNYIINKISLNKALPQAVKLNNVFEGEKNYYINSSINYNCLALKLPCYNGYMKVAESIIDSVYVWNKIRLDGGAYGGGCTFLRNNTMYIYSYRDPHIEKTEAAFKNLGYYLNNIAFSESEFERVKLGAVSTLLKPIKNKSVNDMVLKQALLDLKYSNECEFIRQRLNCTQADVQKIGSTIMENMADAKFVTFGGKK